MWDSWYYKKRSGQHSSVHRIFWLLMLNSAMRKVLLLEWLLLVQKIFSKFLLRTFFLIALRNTSRKLNNLEIILFVVVWHWHFCLFLSAGGWKQAQKNHYHPRNKLARSESSAWCLWNEKGCLIFMFKDSNEAYDVTNPDHHIMLLLPPRIGVKPMVQNILYILIRYKLELFIQHINVPNSNLRNSICLLQIFERVP